MSYELPWTTHVHAMRGASRKKTQQPFPARRTTYLRENLLSSWMLAVDDKLTAFVLCGKVMRNAALESDHNDELTHQQENRTMC